jgi:pimeloyl-ACP methyl ester carboxylesterase
MKGLDGTIGPTSHTYISQRLKLRYVDWGNPQAPLLMLVHGGRDHSRNWDWLAAELRNDWHVIAPDLRGHGDSDHSPDGNYRLDAHVYDLAQLVHQQEVEDVSIIAHSLGGMISMRYAGIYPEKVRRLLSIEGFGLPVEDAASRWARPVDQRFREWIDDQRAVSARQPKRYAGIDAALARMMAENGHLSIERARHLTVHGLLRNEDGSYSWKFDNYVRSFPPIELSEEDEHALWGRIACPTLHVCGAQSWSPNPAKDGRIAYFNNARVSVYENAGHWVHHDRHDDFLAEARAFLA